MPRDRQRLTLDGGPRLDLAKLIPKGSSRPGSHIRSTLTYASGLVVWVEIRLDDYGGSLVVSFSGRQQSFVITARERHFGGQQYYVICPRTGRKVRVLYKPGGAPYFASRPAWGRQAGYASQFLDPVQRAWHTKVKVKQSVLGDADPDEWDLPPKPKGMRWRTYQRWEAKYDAAEDALDHRLCLVVARFMKRGI
jgi:hypothetical protein